MVSSDFIFFDKVYGLASLDKYHLCDAQLLSGRTLGLPPLRERFFGILLRKDIYPPEATKMVEEALAVLKREPLRQVPLSTYFSGGSFELDFQSKRRRKDMMPEDALEKSQKVRNKNGFPRYGKLGAHPFSTTAPLEMLQHLTLREQDCIDLAMLMVMKKTGTDVIPEQFICDASQSPDRATWRVNGSIPSPTTTTRLVMQTGIVDCVTLFNMMGWPCNEVNVDYVQTEKEWRTLVGNMICPPVFGALMGALLSVQDVRPELSFKGCTCMSHESHE